MFANHFPARGLKRRPSWIQDISSVCKPLPRKGTETFIQIAYRSASLVCKPLPRKGTEKDRTRFCVRSFYATTTIPQNSLNLTLTKYNAPNPKWTLWRERCRKAEEWKNGTRIVRTEHCPSNSAGVAGPHLASDCVIAHNSKAQYRINVTFLRSESSRHSPLIKHFCTAFVAYKSGNN